MAQPSVWDGIFNGPPQELINPSLREDRVSARSGRSTSRQNKRPDIQGLRALAVLLVIVDHVGSWPHGGFVGVDVFFVISGFLITNQLVKRAAAGVGSAGFGRYIGKFYLARARRILPAALVILIACWVAASLVFNGIRVSESHADVLWAAMFAANIHFAHIGTDYFQNGRAPSLVQHFWSLSVEEQFYVLWPLVVFLVIALVARRRRWGTGALLAVVVMLTAASFAWGVHQTTVAPTSAYFSPFVRAWELGVGASLAVALANWPGASRRLGRSAGPVAVLGTIGIGVAAVVIRAQPGFPDPAAALPVLATALVIFASSTSRWNLLLTNRVAVYLGDISYSLYLWHWPVIVVTAALLASDRSLYYAVAVLAMLGLSVFSFHFVEKPIHEPARRAEPRLSTVGAPALVALTLVVAATTLYAFKPAPSAGRYAAPIKPLAGTQSPTAPAVKPSPVIARQITAALAATTFPRLSPALDSLGLNAAEAQWQPCDNDVAVRRSCIFGPAHAKHTALVLGDSTALAWMPAIRSALVGRGWRVAGIARQMCSAALVPERDFTTHKPNTACDQLHRFYAHALQLVRPDLVLMSNSDRTMSEMVRSSPGAATQYRQGMSKTLRLVRQAGARAVILSPPPSSGNLSDCDVAGATPASCVESIQPSWFTQSEVDGAVARANHATYIDTRLWFCSSSGYCPAFIGTTPVTYDGSHITSAYAVRLGPELAHALRH